MQDQDLTRPGSTNGDIPTEEVLRAVRRLAPATKRAVRAAVPRRGVVVDEALRALLSKGAVHLSSDKWIPARGPRDTLGHARKGPAQTRKRPSGLQIAFRKAVDALAKLIQALAREPATLARYADRPDLCTRLAEATLREVLSEKQRARLGAPVEPDPVVVFYNDVSRVRRTRPARRAA